MLLAALLAATGLAFATPAAGYADQGGGGDNAAVAVNTKDGATVVKVAFAIRHVMSGVVDQTNAAVAYASCTDCTTVAIAVEIVLVEGSPSVVTPQNYAIAVNELCSLCVTVANALQFVDSTGGPVHFDDDGARMLAEIRQELEHLKQEIKKGDLTLAELEAQIETIRLKIKDVLANHLVPSGNSRNHESETNVQTATTAPNTTTSSTPSGPMSSTPATETLDTGTTETVTTTGP
jgi:putative peptide zinc metalloprotease protein